MDYKELLEDYRDMLKKYCYACVDVSIRKNADGEYYIDGELKDSLYVMGGNFDSDYVADEIKAGDFPFDGVDKEGYWHFEFLLQYVRGDYEEPSYLEQLLVEPSFQISFEDMEKQAKESDDFNW